MDDVDQVGHRAADAMRADVHRRVDVDDALRRLHDDHVTTVVALDSPPFGGRDRRRLRWGAVAAAGLLVVVGGLVVYDSDGSSVSPTETNGSARIVTTTDMVAPPPSTIELPEQSVDALAGFPDLANPSSSTNDVDPDELIDGLPTLLPATPPDGASTAWRSEHVEFPAYYSYLQTWFGEGRGPTILTITTRLGEPGESPIDSSLGLAPWDASAFTSMAPGFAQLTLQDPAGTVEIWSRGLTEGDLLAVAKGLSLRDDRAGWDSSDLPDGLTPVHDGWSGPGTGSVTSTGATMRSVVWTDADDTIVGEVTVARGVPDMFANNPMLEGASTVTAFVTVDGVQGVSYSNDGRAAVVWSPERGVVITVGLVGTAEEAVALARSLGPVDDAAWLMATVPVPAGSDGCFSMFC